MNVKSEQEMIEYGRELAHRIKKPAVIELVGDVGVGKTTFTRGLAEGFGINESITSPSFTISKEYALPGGGRFIHYDFYRLSEPGLMMEDLEEKLREPENVIVIEWGESIKDLLPKEHIKVEIKNTEEGREVII